MIWFALKVTPQKELVAERILRDDGLNVFVPIKHVSVRQKRPRYKQREQRRALAPRPRISGYVFIGVDGDPALDIGQAMRFRFITGVIALGNGKVRHEESKEHEPIDTTLPDIVRLFELNQRPLKPPYCLSKRARRALRLSEITSGPYAMLVKNDDDKSGPGRMSPRPVRTIGGDEYEPDSIIDFAPLVEDDEKSYKPALDEPSSEAGASARARMAQPGIKPATAATA